MRISVVRSRYFSCGYLQLDFFLTVAQSVPILGRTCGMSAWESSAHEKLDELQQIDGSVYGMVRYLYAMKSCMFFQDRLFQKEKLVLLHTRVLCVFQRENSTLIRLG